jgi:hypothetical protein
VSEQSSSEIEGSVSAGRLEGEQEASKVKSKIEVKE